MNLPSIQNRLDIAKIIFFHKTKGPKDTPSIAKKVLLELWKKPILTAYDYGRTPFLQETKQACQRTNLNSLYKGNNNITEEELKKFLKEELLIQNNIKNIERIKKQLNKRIQDEVRCYCPIKAFENPPLLTLLQNYKQITLKHNHAYFDHTITDITREKINILSRCDNNPYWWTQKTCRKCGKKTKNIGKLHKLLHCDTLKAQRKEIFDSLLTEINYIENKTNTIILNPHLRSIYADVAITGIVNKENRTETLENLLGCNINSKKDHQHTQIKKLLNSHLLLLATVEKISQNINEEDYTEITIQKQKHQINKKDLKEGRIVCRIKTKQNTINYKNIRNDLEKLTISELQHFNIGLGTASTRTTNQIALAKKFTEKIITESLGTVTVVDGSINNKEKKKRRFWWYSSK